ncbi:MAG: ribonuclease HI [Oscillospiraceae bacterium]|jgi:ribonuclease HI|nr:ribonuclease HI [Oscillospiraceae bacterium]
MKNVDIYTDGACSGNPGPGGWGVVLKFGTIMRELSGGEKNTTNNRMELTAAIEGLSALNEPCKVRLFTDSKYVSDAINEGWLTSWVRVNFVRKSGPVKNPDLWKRLLPLLDKHMVSFIWVKGHAENEWNNRCDELAVAQSKGYR